MARTINDAGLALIKKFEGCVLEAYPDPGTGGDPWTIGVGHTGPEVEPGMTITEAEAMDLLRRDLDAAEAGVERLVQVYVTDNQFSAMVSLAFNIGLGAFGRSTLLRLLNSSDDQGAADQFAVWKRSGGRVMDGLVRRRAAERDLFLTPDDG